jgi:hypothetical protein
MGKMVMSIVFYFTVSFGPLSYQRRMDSNTSPVPPPPLLLLASATFAPVLLFLRHLSAQS